MCRAVACTQCGKTTWAGCGRHVDQVMAGVPAARRCPGHSGGATPSTAPRSAGAGFLGRLRRKAGRG